MDDACAIKLEFIRRAVASQRFTLRFQLCLAIGVIVFGVVLVLAIYRLGGAQAFETYKWFVTLGGGFIASVAGFPLKDLNTKKDKIDALLFLKQGYERLPAEGAPDSDRSWLDERFRTLVDKSLGA
jgi:hypothetical protein